MPEQDLSSTDICIFCPTHLSPGSVEHVFLSAIGGRLSTRRAICTACNSAFSAGFKSDDAVADGFKTLRNALIIWTGRDKPPPTIEKAGLLENGIPYDLAPGLVPIIRRGKLPAKGELTPGQQLVIPASDMEDASRIIEILKGRGDAVVVGSIQKVSQKVPGSNLRMTFDGNSAWRSIAKTALTGACVMYGNATARSFTSQDLRRSARWGMPAISEFVCWDYTNSWPQILSTKPHKNTPEAQQSGFEHTLLIADVEDSCVAYISLFGHFRFSVWLGAAASIAARGVSLNPRSMKPSRSECSFTIPKTYKRHAVDSNKNNFSTNSNEIANSVGEALAQWQKESRGQVALDMQQKLADRLANIEDQDERQKIINEWVAEVTTIEFGGAWIKDIEIESSD
jgi:hypothetical protein